METLAARRAHLHACCREGEDDTATVGFRSNGSVPLRLREARVGRRIWAGLAWICPDLRNPSPFLFLEDFHYLGFTASFKNS
jgi:hypothetical protein